MKKKTKKKSMRQQKLAELGSEGGTITYKKYGRAHMSMIAKKRWAKRKKKVAV